MEAPPLSPPADDFADTPDLAAEFISPPKRSTLSSSVGEMIVSKKPPKKSTLSSSVGEI